MMRGRNLATARSRIWLVLLAAVFAILLIFCVSALVSSVSFAGPCSTPQAPPATDLDCDRLPDDQESMQKTGTLPGTNDTDGDGTTDDDEDFDGDGLTNFQDLAALFDANWWDTDDDGMGDAQEDNDRDNLTTAQEYRAGFDPLQAESDRTAESPIGNGIRDDFEDTDNDGLDTWEEFSACTSSPCKAPSTNLANYFDPTKANTVFTGGDRVVQTPKSSAGGPCGYGAPRPLGDGAEDVDCDGLSTNQEFERRWDPNVWDTDGDGVRDALEAGDGTEEGRKHRAG